MEFKCFPCSSVGSFAGSRRALTRGRQCGHEDERMVSSSNSFVHPSMYKAQRRVWRTSVVLDYRNHSPFLRHLAAAQQCLAWKPRQLLRARSILLPTLMVAIEKRLYKPVLLAAICDSRNRIEPSRHHNRDGDCTTPPKHRHEVKHPRLEFGGRCCCLGNEAHPSGCNSCVG